MGPHNQAQNASITSVAVGETPMPGPISHASRPSTSTSSTPNQASTSNGPVQPCIVSTLTRKGRLSTSTAPTNGM
ncbi:hypothetical protein D3C83_142320 [compost metagenome]